MDSAKRVASGTFGELWYDGEKVSEVFKFQAKAAINKEEVPMCGEMWIDTKVKNVKGTGSMGLYKVNSRMAIKIANAISEGKDVRGTIIGKIDDPDAYGAERVAVNNVSMDDLTLADWEAGVLGKVETPFTFRGFKYLDMITVV